MTRIHFALVLAALAACAPHPDRSRRALLDLGYHSIVLGDPAGQCAPRTGVNFAAARADGSSVTGHLCCGVVSCDVVEVAL